MNEIEIFKNEEFGTVRTVEKDGKILFCGSDVAKALGYLNSSKALNDHCRCITKCYTPHPQSKDKTIEMSFIPEGDVYRLIAGSKLESAQKFESWVFDEVLPSIRKHGVYAMDEILANPDSFIEALQELKRERAEKARLEAEKKEIESENEDLQIELDKAKDWYSVKRMEKLNPDKKFNWRLLKKESEKMDKEIKKVFDQNYGEVNAYHVSVWESLYFDTLNYE